MQPLKPYNRMQMQLASNSVLSQPPLAAMPQLSEKPRLGFATKKTAWNPGPNVCNFTVTLGLQVAMVENGVRKTYSARYYNPNTGRFMSRDPNEPKLCDANGKPVDPRKLHKYLYAGGDPVNRIDPRGKEDLIEWALENGLEADDLLAIGRAEGVEDKALFCYAVAALYAVTNPEFGLGRVMYFFDYCMESF